MVKTIRVSEEYHEWLSAHKKSDETMEETLPFDSERVPPFTAGVNRVRSGEKLPGYCRS